MSGSGTRWLFTLNNYTDEEYEHINALLSDKEQVTYGIVGKESGENGTPHLQGYCVFGRVHRFGRVKRKLGLRCHIEQARGSSQQNREYCSKDGNFVEHGHFPDNQGKRTDLAALFAWADEFYEEAGRAPTAREVAVEHPVCYVKYPRLVETLQLRCPQITLEDQALNDWQADLNLMLSAEPDDRKIIFVVDPAGGKGKSYFQRYLLSHYTERTQLLGVGKRDDIAHCIDVTKTVFLFNVPRDSMQYLQYTVLEQLKDRCVFSPKYQSTMKILVNKCHVCVFCNEAPDLNKMSSDRYNIINLN